MMEYFIQGGPVMVPLLACSVIALAVIVERALFWARPEMRMDRTGAEDLLERCGKGLWPDDPSAGTEPVRCFVARVLAAGIRNRRVAPERIMESSAAEEMERMQRYMGILDTIITAAPLLGIFGTVLGIIQSFDALGAAGIENPRAVTAGVAQALITTAAGLGIAISTVFPYNYFRARIDRAAAAMEQYGTRLEVICRKANRSPDRNRDGAS